MPIPYKTTRYGCQHGCGTRRRSTAKKAEMHEAICWQNPELKTCKTCLHEVYFDKDMSMVRACGDQRGDALIVEQFRTLINEKNNHIKPIVNCPFWESIEEI